MDIYHLHQEAEPSDRTALQAVVDHIEAEVARLNALEEHIMMEFGPEDERLQVSSIRLTSRSPKCCQVTAAAHVMTCSWPSCVRTAAPHSSVSHAVRSRQQAAAH